MTPLPDVVTYTTNAGDHGSLALSRDWSADVESALPEDHACDEAGCDTCHALEQGFPLVAAHLLSGATETPALDAVKGAYVAADALPNGEDYAIEVPPPEWEGWTTWHDEHARTCDSCSSVTYATDYGSEPDDCSNCGASLTKDYVLAVVFHVRAHTAGAAFEKCADGEVEAALFQTNAMRAEERDVVDPDYGVTVSSHERTLEPIPADEEGSR